MKVKMLTSFAGRDFSLSPGDETERFSEGEVKRLIDGGYCEPVEAKKTVKRAGKKQETAATQVKSEKRG